ncbi:hypothetical protein GCM10023086_05510 [Streptomyces venetus]|uniref:Uncharacterized protein n=1 Tax=Streptomyces venetus TaxID=1701086 RepID=A0ABP8F392_9ACTN
MASGTGARPWGNCRFPPKAPGPPSRPSVTVWAAPGRFASVADMVAQARYFSSRRYVDLRRQGTATCRRPV